MKKAVLFLILMLIMVSSIVAGTLAMYTVSIDDLAEGSVVAKEFVFVGEGTDTFQQGIKIAPSETVTWQFKVKNYENHIISETAMYYKLSFNVLALAGKQAIEPLTVTVKNQNGQVVNSVIGVGSFDVLGAFTLSVNGQEQAYVVEIHWSDDGNDDINYAGNNYGTKVNVDAIASQVPFGTTNPPLPEGISVKYETTTPWQNGQSSIYKYDYKITITNNSAEAIEDWTIGFNLTNDKLTSAWNAILMTGSPQGSYTLTNPAYNNPSTDHILPGQSVSFGGHAQGMGTEAIQNIIVDGSNTSPITNIDLSYEFGKTSLN